MARIEDYAIVGDLHTAALVGSDGSIDWLCRTLTRPPALLLFWTLLTQGGSPHRPPDPRPRTPGRVTENNDETVSET